MAEELIPTARMTGAEFRSLRKRVLGMTQADLAVRFGCSRFHIGNIENAACVPHVYQLAIERLAGQQQHEAA